VLLVALALLSACDFSPQTNIRSGSLDDDYVEEPLGDFAKRFENALAVSNTFIDLYKSNDFEAIYQDIFSDELRRKVSLDQVRELLGKVKSAKGEIIRFKKMQWGFFNYFEEGRNLIASTKIVEHENGLMKYLFVFDNDGKFEKIVGFRFKERAGVSPPGQF
jgi:hypothetical protein